MTPLPKFSGTMELSRLNNNELKDEASPVLNWFQDCGIKAV
jgi:hypothetical protein